jgi:hypothetical protein
MMILPSSPPPADALGWACVGGPSPMAGAAQIKTTPITAIAVARTLVEILMLPPFGPTSFCRPHLRLQDAPHR